MNRTPYHIKELILRSALVDEKSTAEIWEEVKQAGHTMSKLSVRRIIRNYEDTETEYGDITDDNHHDMIWGRFEYWKENLSGYKLTRRVMQDVIHQDTNIFFDFDSIIKVKEEFDNFLKVRLSYVEPALSRNDMFTDAIFAESCSLRLKKSDHSDYIHVDICFSQKKKIDAPISSHPCQVDLWAGISARGATDIFIYDQGRETQKFYVDILKNRLEPFGKKFYPEGFRLIQEDNDIRSSKTVSQYFARAPFVWEKLPTGSSDLNPIYRTWIDLASFLRDKHNPTTKEELISGVQLFWKEQMTPERCQGFIDGLKKNMSMCVRKEGMNVWPWDFNSWTDVYRQLKIDGKLDLDSVVATLGV